MFFQFLATAITFSNRYAAVGLITLFIIIFFTVMDLLSFFEQVKKKRNIKKIEILTKKKLISNKLIIERKY